MQQDTDSQGTKCQIPMAAPFGVAAGELGRALGAAAAAMARLDDRLAMAPEPIRRGWSARMLLEEAAASARLDGLVVDADELRLLEIGALAADPERAVDGVDRVAITAGILRVLRSVVQRHPWHLFTPRRLIAAARLRLKGRPQAITADTRLPDWLVVVPDPQEAREALPRMLSADAMATWRRMAPPVAAADFLGRWHATGCADVIGGAIGRALVPQLLVRLAATGRPVLFPAVGFLGHAADHRPDLLPSSERIAVAWLEACRRSAEHGLDLHSRIGEAHGRLHAALKPERSTGRGGVVADILTEAPAVTGILVAKRTGLSVVAVRGLFDRARRAGALHELTGRAAFRVYGAV